MHGVGAAHGFAKDDVIEYRASSQHQSSQQETNQQAVGACSGSGLWTEEALVTHHEAG